MTLRDMALALHTFEKTVNTLPESRIKQALITHIQEMHELLVTERVLNNEARNFQLTETPVPLGVKTSRVRKTKS